MAPLPVPDTILVSLIWQNNGVPFAINALHYRVPGVFVVNQTTTDEVGTILRNEFNTNIQTDYATTQGFHSVRMRDLRSANLPEFIFTSTLNGTDASGPLPPSLAAVVTTRTAFVGRSFRGRIYVPAGGESTNAAPGIISTGFRDRLNLWGESIRLLNPVAGELQLSVVSRTSVKTIRNPPLSTPVTSAAVRDQLWDTQRRRADFSLL